MLAESYNTIISRGALMPGGIAYREGRVVPRELAYVECGGVNGHRVVTWAEIMERRREQQRQRLRQIGHVNEWRAYKVWVAYFDQFLMGGWHAFIENRDDRHWIDRDRPWLCAKLMRLFPLVMRFDEDSADWRSSRDDFHRWKQTFAAQFKRRTQDRRPVGVAYVWWNGYDDPRKECP